MTEEQGAVNLAQFERGAALDALLKAKIDVKNQDSPIIIAAWDAWLEAEKALTKTKAAVEVERTQNVLDRAEKALERAQAVRDTAKAATWKAMFDAQTGEQHVTET